MKKLFLLAVIASALFSSCQKNVSPAPGAKNIPGGIGAKSQATLTTDIYIAGLVVDPGSITTASYWINGKLTRLPKSGPSVNTRASAIAVSGTDIYVAGNDNNTACYWKNGVEHIFPQPNPNNLFSYATGVAISAAGDVYIIGGYSSGSSDDPDKSYNVAVMWKNNVRSLLAFNKMYSAANDITIDGNDVYVAGTAALDENSIVPIYWKNNIWHPYTHNFPDGPPVQGEAESIVVDKNHNFYISGNQQLMYGHQPVTGYWKDGNFFPLTSVVTGGLIPGGIAVNNDNQTVYVGNPFPNKPASYFKNGVSVTLPGSRGPVTSMAYSDGDVYATASLSALASDSSAVAIYFKNSTAVKLEGTDVIAGRMIVVKH